jgi:hypothetical protein
MGKKDAAYRTIKTIEGTIFHVYEDDQGKIKPHSPKVAAVQYPKSEAKPDEYYLFGIKYDYDKWLELSRPFRRAVAATQQDLSE